MPNEAHAADSGSSQRTRLRQNLCLRLMRGKIVDWKWTNIGLFSG